MSTYIKDIRIPTFLTQGQSDNLFNLQESVATYKALKAQGVPVKMLWRSSGHSGGGIGKSENDATDLEAPTRPAPTSRGSTTTSRAQGRSRRADFTFLTDWIA